MKTKRKIRAFTLIELLVTVAIIAVLATLVFVGLNGAWNMIGNLNCMNNMRSLGQGFISYEQQHRAFPANGAKVPDLGYTENKVFNFHLLPHVALNELDTMHRKDKTWNAPENRKLIARRVESFICPFAPVRDPEMRFGYPVAVGDYAIMTNYYTDNPAFDKPPSGNTSGAVAGSKRLPTTAITDGCAHTFLVTECAGRPEFWTLNGRKTIQISDTRCGNYGVLKGGVIRGAGWADADRGIPVHGFKYDGETCFGPCVINCTNNNEPFSFHEGSINVIFADGAVKTLSENIHPMTFVSGISYAGDEVMTRDEMMRQSAIAEE